VWPLRRPQATGQEKQLTNLLTRALAPDEPARQPRPEACRSPAELNQVPEFHRAWNPGPQTPLHGPRCQARAAAFARSIPLGVLAFHARGFHEPCNVHNADYGFAAAKKGSIVTSRPTSGGFRPLPQRVLLPRRELLFGEAERIMSSYRCGCNENDHRPAASMDRPCCCESSCCSQWNELSR
jgi:hypothetical protein